MGSVGAMNKGSADRYFQKNRDSSKYVPEGVEGLIKFKGDVQKIIFKLIGGLRSSMGYLGAKGLLIYEENQNLLKLQKLVFMKAWFTALMKLKKIVNIYENTN